MGRNHAELYSITPFKEEGRWYLHLVYRYEDKGGILSTTPPDLCNIRLYTLENPPFISFKNQKLFLIQA